MRGKFGLKKLDHPSIGVKCYACGVEFKEGDFTTLVALGPGNDEEAREAAKEGRSYNAVAIEIHYDCADQG